MIGKYLRKLFSRDYGPFATEFAEKLGYTTWKEVQGNSYAIFTETDHIWFATEMSDSQWAVWKDEGEMPHPFSVFSTWNEAVHHLRNRFDESGLPESHWIGEGPKEK